ncbi:MAG: hypothetical protein RMI01_08745 [Thermodesulfovibrio sp.]|nr:hypothetical protein [Thermodesulfovibrio sp.]
MKSKQGENIIGYLIAGGLIDLGLILILNAVLFVVTLFYSEKSLPFMLGFFAISIIGRFLFRKK